jgi:AraC-like DNA-binding protein
MRDAQRSQDIENASLQVGAMQYQADRALEQFDLCDPKNRHVADTLEERLNARLTDLESAKQRYQEIVDAKPAVSDHVCARLGALSQDFSKVWSHTMADPKLKKQLLRAAIQEIMVTPQEGQLEVTIHWQGDVHTQVYVKRPVRTAGQPLEPIEKLIRELAQQLSDEEIARILNLKKFETPGALRWTRDRVCNFRRQRKIKAAPKTTTQDTMTMSEIRKHLGISQSSVESLARLGAITTNQITEFAPWRVARTEVESERVQDLVRHLKRTGRLPKGGCRQTQPGLFDTGKALTTEIKKGAL